MTEETIFLAAREMDDPAARTAYLDEACAGDPALRQRIEALLRSDQEPNSFLDTPAVEEVARAGEATWTLSPSAAAGVRRSPEPRSGAAGRTEAEPYREEQALALLAPSREAGSLGRLGHYEVLEVVGHGGMGT